MHKIGTRHLFHETLGVQVGKGLVEVAGTAESGIDRLGALLQESNLSLGIDSEVKHADTRTAERTR